MNQTGISQINQARIEWAIRLRYSPMPEIDMQMLASQLNALRIGELRLIGKTWEAMMERDGELGVNSDKRKADSAGLEWQVVSDGSLDGDKHAAALQYFYENLTATKALDQDSTGGVDELVYQTLSSLDYYYSAHEILLRIDNPAAKEVTAEFRHTPMWFFEARRGYLGYLKNIFDMYGQPCIGGEWLTAVNLGWMRPLTMAYAAKWFSMTDWLIFNRRYGSGFLEAETDAQKDTPEWNQAQEALTALANDGVVMHNKGVTFKFLEQSAKNQLPFLPVIELVDRLYAKVYRGVDLATGSRGSGAKGGGESSGSKNPVGASVQQEESGIFLIRDAKWVTGTFNERIDRPIIRYLFGQEPRAWFVLVPPLDDTTVEDLASVQALVPLGMRVMLKEAYKRFHWTPPEPGEPCLEAQQQPSQLLGPDGKPIPGQPPPKPQTLPPPKPAEQDGRTRDAQTEETTPIAPGADPARNPGLLPPGRGRSTGASRQMPGTQIDAGSFWSRAGLVPRGADGQMLPMPSLGYAIPNSVLIHLPGCRAVQAVRREQQKLERIALANAAESQIVMALHDSIAPVLKRLEQIAAISDPDTQRHLLQKLLADFPALERAITADDSVTKALTPDLLKSFVSGLHETPALANGDVPGHEFHGNQWTDESLAAETRPVRKRAMIGDEVVFAQEGKAQRGYLAFKRDAGYEVEHADLVDHPDQSGVKVLARTGQKSIVPEEKLRMPKQGFTQREFRS